MLKAAWKFVSIKAIFIKDFLLGLLGQVKISFVVAFDEAKLTHRINRDGFNKVLDDIFNKIKEDEATIKEDQDKWNSFQDEDTQVTLKTQCEINKELLGKERVTLPGSMPKEPVERQLQVSKVQFVLNQPRSMSAAKVVAKAKAEGLIIKPNYVYKVRSMNPVKE